jgi:signal peptidase
LRGAVAQIALAAAWGVLTVAATLTAYALVSLAAGWRPAVVTSASMLPALRPGDVVLFEPVGARPLVGAIVLFRRPGTGQQVAHRVAAVHPDGELVTKGDANLAPDSELLAPAEVRGQARLVLPRAGALRLLTTPYWHSALPWLALLLASAALALTVPTRAGRPTPDQARSGRARSGRARSGRARSGRARSGRARSGRARSGHREHGGAAGPAGQQPTGQAG